MNFRIAVVLTAVLVCAPLQAEFRSAIAIRNVTPDPLLPVSGGVGASHPVTEKKGDLTVRALVLENSGTRIALVGADFLGFPSVLGDKVRSKVEGIHPENILIGATHTHSAPDCYGFPDGQGGFATDLKYLDRVCNEMADAINEAVAHLQTSQLKIASGEAKGKIAYNYYAPDLYDPRCNVLQTLTPDGKVIATLVNYAIHPEVIGSSQGILSPDLVGPLYQQIAEKTGGVAIFMNSAQGGMITADNRAPEGKEHRDWNECERIGRLLGDEALRIVGDAKPQTNPMLFCTNQTVDFKVDSPLLLQVMKVSPLGYKAQRHGYVSTMMNVVNIGNAQIITIPGEALPNIGYYLKRKMHGEVNFLFGLTNDAFGYILTKEDFNSFKRYQYVSRTSLGEGTADTLITAALELVNNAPDPAKAQATN
jgi:hypothetical protein